MKFASGPVRVLISYAHDDETHRQRVKRFWSFLRENGIDASLDLPAAEDPQDWPLWMLREIRAADFVLVVASPMYKLRAEGGAPYGAGRGGGWESRLIRQEVYDDPEGALLRILPIVLPGCSPRDIPTWLSPIANTYYEIAEYTVAGAEPLLRYLTGQRRIVKGKLGAVPALPAEKAEPISGKLPAQQPAITAISAQQLVREFGELYGKALQAELTRQVAHLVNDPRDPLLIAFNGAILGDAGRLVQVQGEDLRAAISAFSAERSYSPFQAPLALAQFTGRSGELTELRLLAVKTGTVVCISGMGGTGKSALAVQFAHEEGHRFEDGVLWADLRRQDIGAILESFARAYGEDLSTVPDRLSKAEALRSILAQRHALIILDNVEPDTDVDLLLPSAGPSFTIVTSRHRNLRAMRGARHLALGLFDESDSLRHLEKVLGQSITATDSAPARALVAFCGFLPLALDILARLVKQTSLSVQEFADIVLDEAHGLDIMSEGERSVVDCFNLTWIRLTQQQRDLLASSSILGGSSFGIDVLRHINGLSRLEARVVMGQLVSMSVVGLTSSGRYRLHPLLREFAATRLRGMGDDFYRACRLRIADYYIDLLRTELGDSDLQPGVSELVDLEFDSVLAAWRLARSHEAHDHVVAIACAFTPYLFHRGHWDVCDEMLADAVAASATQRDEPSYYLLSLRRGELLRERADYVVAAHTLDPCLTYYRAQDDRPRLARTLRELGELMRVRRNYSDSLRLHQECLQLRRQLNDPLDVAQSLHDCGLVERILGDYDAAVRHFVEAMKISRHVGAELQLSYSTLELGIASRKQERFAEAGEHLTIALARFQAHRDRRGEAYTLRELGELAVDEQQFDRARRYHVESIRLRDLLGDARGKALSLYMLGFAERSCGDEAAAIQHYAESLRLARGLDDRLTIALTQLRIGEIAESAGRIAKARASYLEADQLFRDMGVRHYKEAGLVTHHLSRLGEPSSEPEST
jgi:tetratricopeptide (TPR) repeat protein